MKTAAAKPRELEGSWELTVTLRCCQTGVSVKSFRAISIFNNTGTLTETSANDAPPVGAIGQGFWRHIGGAVYTATTKLFCFNQNGKFAGIERVTRNIDLSVDGERFTATASVEVFDPNDRLVRTGCATIVASRLQ